MELLLNLAWLAVAIAAFARLGVWASAETDRRRIRLAFVATACVIVLLFPIISITDDLEASVAVVEESATVRRAAASAVLHVVPTLATTLALAVIAAALTLLGFLTEESFVALPSLAAPVLSVRGPPSFAC
jgi:hypothetical protein